MQKFYQSSFVVHNASIRVRLNCCVYTTVVTITKTTCPTEYKISDIKTVRVGHHVRKERILVEFLKTRCANG